MQMYLSIVAAGVGAGVGAEVGTFVGTEVGFPGGAVVGSAVGTAVGGFVGSDVGTAVGGFVGPVVGTAVGGFVGSDVVGAGGGCGARQPLVVSNTADTGLEKWLPPSCSMTQKNAGKSRKRRCRELVSRYRSKEIIKELRNNLPPPLQANSPLLYVLIWSITCAA